MERNIYLMGNPAVVWITSGCILAWIILGVAYFHVRHYVRLPRKYVRTLEICRYASVVVTVPMFGVWANHSFRFEHMPFVSK